jgi:Rrf2 family protein
MKMSNGVEWAIHSCSVLAELVEGQALPAAKLAEFHGVPAPYLSKHMQALVRAGICESVPGPHGGFRLSRPSDEITFLDVMLAVDGEEHAFQCTEIRQRGPSAVPLECYTGPCTIAAAMLRAEEAWRRELSSVTIADINAGLPAEAHPDQLAAGAAWLVETLAGRG